MTGFFEPFAAFGEALVAIFTAIFGGLPDWVLVVIATLYTLLWGLVVGLALAMYLFGRRST